MVLSIQCLGRGLIRSTVRPLNLRNNEMLLSSFNRNMIIRNLAITPFKLADIGEGIAEVELMKWFINKGDSVKAFDRICEVQSDKATVEITSRFDGVITAVHYEEGAIVKVGAALIDIDVKDSAKKLTNNDPQPVLQTAPTSTFAAHPTPFNRESSIPNDPHGGKVLTTPAVRKLAKENGIDLSQIEGSGPKGRVVKEDVLLFLQQSGGGGGNKRAIAISSTPFKSSSNSNSPSSGSKASPSSSSSSLSHLPIVKSTQDRTVPIRGVQRMMVKSMNAALQVQHLTLCEEICVDQLVKLRKELKTVGELEGIKLSYMPILIKATSLALNQFPILNSTVAPDASEMTYHANHHIGVAMDTPKGLVVPVVKFVQNKSIFEIARELSILQEAAAKGTLTEAQLSGGTFSLSNIGSIGGTYAVPVIVVPQVAIGAIGRQQILPRYVNKDGKSASADDIAAGNAHVHPSTIMNISWSADHRVIDGATVARFSNVWKSYLETPISMLAHLQ